MLLKDSFTLEVPNKDWPVKKVEPALEKTFVIQFDNPENNNSYIYHVDRNGTILLLKSEGIKGFAMTTDSQILIPLFHQSKIVTIDLREMHALTVKPFPFLLHDFHKFEAFYFKETSLLAFGFFFDQN